MLALDDTICAVASAPGGAARGIVRISGPGVLATISHCFRSAAGEPAMAGIEQPSAVEGQICSILNGARSNIPATVFFWPTDRSYTRQPLAEFHTFGSPPLLNRVVETLCAAGARLAQPGEFTMRAFLAGRIDLTQAEAVLGVIDAADRNQLEAALGQLAGGLSIPLQHLRSDLLNLLADLEAGLDFVEEDIRFVDAHEVDTRLASAANQLEGVRQRLSGRAASAGQPRVVLAGWPNAGKSSLFNALANRSTALVSPQAGTTRDYLSTNIRCGNFEIELIDTAGIDEGLVDSGIDQAAQTAALGQHRQADLRIFCLDATRPSNRWERQQLDAAAAAAANLNRHALIIACTKCDQLQPAIDTANHTMNLPAALPTVFTSSHTGHGLAELRSRIEATIAQRPSESFAVAGTAARAAESIRLAAGSICHARQQVAADEGEELIAVELRTALAELGKVVGAVYTDDLLDRIFSRFCIGK